MRTLGLLVACCGLMACGQEDLKTGELVLHGHYDGVLTSSGIGLGIEGVVSDEGDAVFYSSSGEFFYGGVLDGTNSGEVDGLFAAYAEVTEERTRFAVYGERASGASAFEGAGVTRQGFSGFVSAGSGVARLDLAFDTNKSALGGSLAAVEGSYEGIDGGAFWRLNVSRAGLITGTDNFGCTFSGALSLPTRTNTYAIRELVMNCGGGDLVLDGVAYKESGGLGISLYGDEFIVVGNLPDARGGT